jgi:hypothetical protein
MMQRHDLRGSRQFGRQRDLDARGHKSRKPCVRFLGWVRKIRVWRSMTRESGVCCNGQWVENRLFNAK